MKTNRSHSVRRDSGRFSASGPICGGGVLDDERAQAVADHHLDVSIADSLRGQPLPDVTFDVLEELRSPARRYRRVWLSAALTILGLGVVVGIAAGERGAGNHAAGDGAVATRGGAPVPFDVGAVGLARAGLTASDGSPVYGRTSSLGPEVIADSMPAIANLPLDTDNVRLTLHTAEAVRSLARLRKLRRLDASFEVHAGVGVRSVPRPEFFPDAAKPLGMLTSLEQLDISGHGPVAGLDSLATLARLKWLRIFRALVDPDELAVLSKLPSLQELVLAESLSTDVVRPLLDLRTAAGDGSLAAIAGGKRLCSLWLGDCIADAEGFEALAKNPVEKLHLDSISATQPVAQRRVPLAGEAYVPIGMMATLRELRFGGVVSPKLLANLREQPLLEVLNLDGADGLHGRAIGMAVAGLAHVRRLSADGARIDKGALLGLAESKSIVDLHLGGGVSCDDEVIAAVAKMPALRRLALPYSHGVTDDGMVPLATSRLEHFSLTTTNNLTPEGLVRLPKSLRSLVSESQSLDVAVFSHLDRLRQVELEFYMGHSHRLIVDLHASPACATLEELTLVGELGGLESVERLLDFPALRVLDCSDANGSLPEQLVESLRQRRVVVTLPPEGERGSVELIEVAPIGRGGQGGGESGGRDR